MAKLPPYATLEHHLVCGENRLILGDRIYHFISKRGEIPALLEVLRGHGETFYTSVFGAAHGYRLSLEGKKVNRMELKEHETKCVNLFIEKYPGNDWIEFAESYITQKRQVVNPKEKLLGPDQISIEELPDVAEKICQIAIFQQAKSLISSDTNYQRQIDNIHFYSLTAFAYHTLKHPCGSSPLFENDHGTWKFNFQHFEQNAKNYLQIAQRIIRNSSWTAKVPDQYNNQATDHAFYVWKDKDFDLHKILEIQQAIYEKKREIKHLKIELQNIRYSSCNQAESPQYEKHATKVNHLLTNKIRLENERNALLTKTLKKVPVAMTVIRIEKKENFKIWIKSSFDTDLNVENARKGQLQSSSSEIGQ